MTLRTIKSPFDRPVPRETKPIRPDTDDFAAVNGQKLFVIHRGQRYGVRIKDNNSEYRKGFTRLDWFPVDPTWRITANTSRSRSRAKSCSTRKPATNRR